jgi:nucleotide-binding universal stress UspA family protein
MLGGLGSPPVEVMQAGGKDLLHRMLEAADVPEELVRHQHVCGGAAAAALIELSDAADLLVVGHRGRGAVVDTLSGSISSSVAAHSHVPVAVIPEGFDPPKPKHTLRTLVAVDGSENAKAALLWAVDTHCEDDLLSALHFWQVPSMDLIDPTAITATMQRHQEDDARSVVARMVQETLGDRGPMIRQLLTRGDTRLGLIDSAREADLMVIGQRGHSGLARMVFGSIASFVVHHLTIPTVFVPTCYRDGALS